LRQKFAPDKNYPEQGEVYLMTQKPAARGSVAASSKRRCRRSAVMADLQAHGCRIGPADAHSVHVHNKLKLGAAAVLGLQVEIDL
jgi:hypothetical protein